MMIKRLFLQTILLFVSLSPFNAMAFKLVPMVAQLTPNGSGKSQVFQITNNGQSRIAIQMKVTTRKQDLQGNEIRESSDDFLIYPEQISLAPNDSRNVRLTYKGKEDIKSEQAYRLIAKQLPVEFETSSQQSQLKFLFEYVASVYITPMDTSPKLEVTMQKMENQKIVLRIKNTGSSHQLLKDISANIRFKNEDISFSKEIQDAWDATNLLADSEREFIIPTKFKSSDSDQLKISISNRIQKP